MKKVLILSLFIGSVLLAGYTKEDRVKDMQAMAAAMEDIQKGFLYNSNDMVQKGVTTLRDRILTVQPPRVGDRSLSRDEHYAFMFARKQQRKIDDHAGKLSQQFADGDKYQAMHHFTKILKQCTACHVKLRKW